MARATARKRAKHSFSKSGGGSSGVTGATTKQVDEVADLKQQRIESALAAAVDLDIERQQKEAGANNGIGTASQATGHGNRGSHSRGDEAWPFAALGVLSGTSLQEDSVHARFETRRRLVRSSWMMHANVDRGSGGTRRSMVVRFVLRCGGLVASHSLRSEPDVLCTPVPAQESRQRGPILALHFWLGHALKAYPAARFICKSDDDVYLHTPDLEAHLRSIPVSGAPHAYYGAFNFYHVSERPATSTQDSRFTFLGYAPSYGWAKHVARKHGYERLCPSFNASYTSGAPPQPGADAISCAGPFPYAAATRNRRQRLSTGRCPRAHIDFRPRIPPTLTAALASRPH